jgi:thiol:disulfide interchange protein DsbD
MAVGQKTIWPFVFARRREGKLADLVARAASGRNTHKKLGDCGSAMTYGFPSGQLVGWAFAGLALAFAAMGTSGAGAQAGSEQGHHVKASLVAETRSIVAGQPVRLALRQQIEPGWHTYWSNPGESGLPTTIDWRLPQGFRAGAISWPAPERFSFGPVVSYGYEREVLLPVTMDVPADVRSGTIVTLAAHASWLVCAETCIPEEAEITISLPVGATREADPQWAEAFATTLARTPAPNPFPTTVETIGDQFALHILTGDATHLRDVAFFPLDPGVIDDAAPQRVIANAEGLTVTLDRDTTSPPAAALNGVLAFKESAVEAASATRAILIGAPIDRPPAGAFAGLGILVALALAFAGGIVLNLMPCVLPILSIKVLALVQHSHVAPGLARNHGVAYTAGVLTSFAAVAAALMALRGAGAQIGWGFQLQSPLFVASIAYVLFAVGLNLSGVFSFGSRLAGVGADFTLRPGYAGSFFTGALATLVATPCTAPFMASAIGFAVTQPWYVSIAVFEALGLGLAFPYLLVAFNPGLRRFLPRPGIWMLRLKQFLAFPIYGTVIWLVFVLSAEAGEFAVSAVLAGLVMIAFAAWLYDATWSSEGRWRGWAVGLSTVAVLGAFALLGLVDGSDAPRAAQTAGANDPLWQPFSRARLDELRAEGTPVFIDFTAAWCITCKVNERIALSDAAVLRAFLDTGVAMLRADWTRQDPDITRELEANGRVGVPLYLFYPRPKLRGDRPSPVVLPQILTADSILREVESN